MTFLKSLGVTLEGAPTRDSFDLLQDFNVHVGNDSETWKSVIGKEKDLKPNSVQLLDFSASYCTAPEQSRTFTQGLLFSDLEKAF